MKGKAKAVEFENEEYNIIVKGHHVLVTDAMKNYAIEKVSKIERFSTRIIDVSVTMDIQKNEHRVDIDMRVNHVHIRSHASTTDMYVSIDQAIDRLKKQLRRYHSRLAEHQAKGIAMVDMNVNVVRRYNDDLSEINEDIEDENQRQLFEEYQPQVVSQETRPLKTLTMEEAVMRLDLSDDPFLLYRSEEDQKLKVIYRREDRDFGIIEPE
ncbi:MAG: ribosome-associated translation inhibitor RaiA [Chlamydiia bacterium]|nr:ribosome-associated translation inhibitor RaiA [Chlamydiia bacterium]